MQVQPQIVEFVFTLSKYGCGASIVREMIELLKYLYTQGGDFTKVQNEFFEPIIQLINNAKTQSLQRLILIKLSGKIFKAVWTRCANPPTKDLFDAYTRLKPTQTEKFVRESAYRALKDVIKVNPSNLFQIQQEVQKHLIKAQKDEKIGCVKIEILACLRVYIQFTMNYSSMHTQFDTLFQTAIKGFEEDQETQKEWIRVCVALLNMRLQESQQQGDIKSGFKLYNQQQRDQINPGLKKKQTMLDAPRSLSDAISYFSAMMLQQSNQQIQKAIAQVLAQLFEQNPTHLEATDVELILNSLLLSISCKKDSLTESYHQRETCLWILTNAVSLMQFNQRAALLKLAIQSLERQQLLISVGTLQQLQGFCGKGQSTSTLINDSHHILLLRVSTEIIFSMEGTAFHNVFQQEKEITNAVNPYLKFSRSIEVKLYAVELVKTIGFRAPRWIHNLISLYLSMASIQNADTQSLSQTIIYGSSIADKVEVRRELLFQTETLKILSLALASLICSVNHIIEGIPLALVATALNAAKTQILGNWPLEPSPEQANMMDLNLVLITTNQRQESGWIILEGLLNLGSEWIDTQANVLMKLFKTVFSQKMCEIDLARIKDQMYQELLLREFKIKKQAIACMRIFLVNCSDNLRQRINSVAANFLGNALSFLMHPTGEKGNVEKVFRHYLESELFQARADLLFCLTKIPPEFFQQLFLPLLHPLCEIIIDNKDSPNAIPQIAQMLLFKQDQKLSPDLVDQRLDTQSPSQKRYAMLINKLQSQTDQIVETQILCLCKPLSLTQPQTNKRVQSHQTMILNSAIQLFSNIFLCDHLTETNKLQLLKHLHQSIIDKKDCCKTTRICATLLNICRLINEFSSTNGKIASYNTQMAMQQSATLTNDEYSKIFEILNSMFQIENDFLTRMAAETYVYLLAPRINSTKSILPQVLNDLEQQIASVPQAKLNELSPQQMAERSIAKKKAAIVCALLVRLFDYDFVIAEQSDRITNIMLKLLKENDLKIRKFVLHFACEIGVEGLHDMSDETLTNYFDQIFPSCYHLVQTDIQLNGLDLASISKLINSQLRFFEPNAQKQPPSPLRIFLSGNKRMQTLIHEMIEIMFFGKQSNRFVLMESIQMVKSAIIIGLDVVETRKTQIVTRCLELLRANNMDCKLKQKLVETLAAAIHKGYLQENAKLAAGLQNILIDELNLVTFASLQFEAVVCNKLEFEKVLSGVEAFEAIINHDGANMMELEEISDVVGVNKSIYKRSLQIVVLMVLKMIPRAGFPNCFKNILNLTKTLISYKHSTMLQQLENGLKHQPNRVIIDDPSTFFFKFDLSEEVVYFICKAFKSFTQLFATVSAGNGDEYQKFDSDVRSQVSNLINLAFTIISQESIKLKKVGLQLIISLVKLFSQAVEKVGDDDEDDGSNKLKSFLQNPLLLEQYEAQIYSIIRTHLQNPDSSKGPLPPKIIAKNFELIYLFVTSPICKDQQVIKKILDMLMEGMEKPMQSTGAEMHSYEGVISDTHFKKLILLSKFVIVAQQDGQGIIQKLSQLSAGTEKVSVQHRHKPELHLPCKYQTSDQERLSELIFKPERLQILSKNLVFALSDALIASLGAQGDTRKLTFIVSIGGEGSAYTPVIVAQSVSFCLQALSLIAGKYKDLKLSQQQRMVVRSILLYNLHFQPNQLSTTQLIDKKAISIFANQKLMYLQFVEQMLAKTPQLICSNTAELKELLAIVAKLTTLGVLEINRVALSIMALTVRMIADDKDLTGQAFQLVTSLVFQILPELKEDLKQDTQGDFNGFSGYNGMNSERDQAKQKLSKVQFQTFLSPFFEECGKILFVLTQELCTKSQNQIKPLLQSFVVSAALGIDKIVQEENKKLLAQILTRLIEIVAKYFKTNEEVFELITAIGCKMVLQMIESGNAFSEHSSQIFKAIMASGSDKNHELRCSLQILLSYKTIPNCVINQLNQCFQTFPPELQKEIAAQSFQRAFDSLHKNEGDQVVVESLKSIELFYASPISSYQRADLLPVYLALLFTVMQTKQLQPLTRQKGAEAIVQIFKVDQQAIKFYGQPDPTTGKSKVTPLEKTLIENVIKQFAMINTQTAVAQQSSVQNKPTQETQKSNLQTQSAGAASKIKLGFNFKSNK